MMLIQPHLDNISEYLKIAQTYKLEFEIIDLIHPDVLENENALRQIADCYTGVPIFSMHGVFIDLNFSGGDPLIFEVSKRRIEQCFDAAEKMGIKRIVLHNCLFPLLKTSDSLYDYWADSAARLLVPLADKYGTEIYVENVLDISPFVLDKMMKTINHKNIGVCLDIGHANLSKTSFEEWIKTLHPHIKYLHLSDNNGIFDEHLALGDGNIDFAEVFLLLERYEISAPTVLEVETIGNIKKSLKYLSALPKTLCGIGDLK